MRSPSSGLGLGCECGAEICKCTIFVPGSLFLDARALMPLVRQAGSSMTIISGSSRADLIPALSMNWY